MAKVRSVGNGKLYALGGSEKYGLFCTDAGPAELPPKAEPGTQWSFASYILRFFVSHV